jgi:hypothetical protein
MVERSARRNGRAMFAQGGVVPANCAWIERRSMAVAQPTIECSIGVPQQGARGPASTWSGFV